MSCTYLICEDLQRVASGIKERIVNELNVPQENVSCFYFADEALTFLEKNTPDFIIIDLAMDPTGLSKEEREATDGCRLTGWIVLKNYIIEGEFKDQLINTKCYIFSGYGKVLSSELGILEDQDRYNEKEINKKLKDFRQNLFFISKRGSDGGLSDLINAIKK